MSNSENHSRFEELAALHALGLLDENAETQLLQEAERDPKLRDFVRELEEAAATLALEAPRIQPPLAFKTEILRHLPPKATASNVTPFSRWIPYAVAACLMLLCISQVKQIILLKQELLASQQHVARLKQSNDLIGLRLTTLEAKDAAYNSSRIIVAWDPNQHRGAVGLENLPAPPSGHDYQLWVLDPSAEAPIDAGILSFSRPFVSNAVSTQNPGFAVSLEPRGGSHEPTGPILFAVAPGL